MPIPDYQTLMLPVLRLAAEGETNIRDAEQRLADEFGLTEAEREQMLPSGRQRVLYNRIQWAKSYLGKAGMLSSPRRGYFIATPAGRELLTGNPKRIDNATLMAFPQFVEFIQPAESSDQSPAKVSGQKPADVATLETPEESIEAAHSTMQAALRTDLLERILLNSPDFFEQVIVNLLVAMGYGGSHRNAAAQLGRSGDGGVDGVINEDRLGLDRVYIQAKRYAPGNTVGRPEVQGFVGSLVGMGATKGVFVTTSTFSSGAIEYAKHLTQRIILIDGQRLADLMIEHNVGVRIARIVEFKRIDEDFFAEEG
jgi:restriction system protein